MYVEFFSETKSNLKGARISQSQVPHYNVSFCATLLYVVN